MTGGGSPASPPTPGADSSPSRSCGTAAAPAWRTGSAKDTGLGKLPCRHAAANRVWIAIVLLACELLAWTQTLALTGPLPAAEPKTLRLRLLAVAGRLVRTGRRTHPRLDRDWPSAATVAHAVATLHAIPDSA